MDASTAKSPASWQTQGASKSPSTYSGSMGGAWRTGVSRRTSDHLGVTDDQIARVAAPAGEAFDDEPRQG
jgi:hypothetical protein